MGAGGRQWGRRKQWTSRPAAGDLWTRHSVIALDPFVFKRSREEEGWRWRGWWWWWRWGLQGRKWFTMTPIFQHFHPWPQQRAWFASDGMDWAADLM